MMRPAEAEWQEFYARNAPRLLLYARQWVANPADAEDVVQMAFVRYWRRFPGGSRENLPLLFSAVRSVALDLHRASRRRDAREAASEPGAPFFDTAIEDRETAAVVQRALEGLPPEQREVVALRAWGGLTFAEIARVTGESPNTVASRHRYALETLGRKLAPFREDLALASNPQNAHAP